MRRASSLAFRLNKKTPSSIWNRIPMIGNGSIPKPEFQTHKDATVNASRGI